MVRKRKSRCATHLVYTQKTTDHLRTHVGTWNTGRTKEGIKMARNERDVFIVPTRFRTQDITYLRKKYEPGTKLIVTAIREDGEDQHNAKPREMTVVQTFRRHVSCVNKYGQRESFGYFELEQAGKIL